MIEEGITDGCILLVRQQHTVDEGKVAVVLFDQSHARLRKIFYQTDELMILGAANRSVPPKACFAHEVQILGQVIQVTKKL